MEEICSSETSVDFQRTTQRYIPEDRTPCILSNKYKQYNILVQNLPKPIVAGRRKVCIGLPVCELSVSWAKSTYLWANDAVKGDDYFLMWTKVEYRIMQ
jgi:hypothetical protein